MKAVVASFLSLVLGFAGFTLFAGQKPAATAGVADDPQSRIVLDVSRVNLLFTVADKKGRFITDLGKDDFEILESKKPQQILEFTAETDLPLRLAILIDTSNSIRDRFRFQQEAAVEFINSVMRPRTDKAVLVSFDMTAELVTDLTNDTEKLRSEERRVGKAPRSREFT